jgi:hypothetical protein
MADTPVLVSSLSSGAAPVDAPKSAQSPEQLRALAAQFESLLLTQLLNSMRSSMFGDEESGDSGFAKGPLADALYGELSLALSRAGGMGLGDMVMSPLMKQAGVSMPPALDVACLGGLASLQGSPTLEKLSKATGIDLTSAGNTDFTAFPTVSTSLSTRVTSAFGWRRDPIDGSVKLHKGTDLAMALGQEVPAARSGEVAFVGEQSGYGLTILINHDGHRATRYAHLSEAHVKAGEAVVEGQVIAKSGASGRATGPHLHFELLEDGQPVDPAGRLGLLGSAIQISD